MLTISWNGKRYRLDTFTSKRKNWKILVIILFLIIIYQYINYEPRHIAPEIPREFWPFKIAQHYPQRFLPEYSPAQAFVEPSSNHPGANGEPVYIPTEKYEIMQKLYEEEHFNVLASDMMPFQRTLPDYRYSECKEIQYPHRLPTTSVIIAFHNEIESALLRTVWSVINHSPKELIEEIILVDDFSTRDNLKVGLEKYVATLPIKVHLIRTTKREGLIRARLLGAHHAEGSVLTFLDAHIECTEGWLEPILNRIYNDRSVIAVPHIDAISIIDMSYIRNDEKIYGFDWDLIFFGYDVPHRENQRRNFSRTASLRTPTMIGCAFSIDREFFYEIGAYDEGMHIWGSENMEMSIRAWLCGGSLEIIPCSRVGHLFRTSSYTFEGDEEVIKTINNIRFAEVWMDEYKQFYYAKNREAKYTQFGDLEDRFAIRQELHCKNFQWFLKNIYPESELLIGLHQIGKLVNEETGTCLDVLSRKIGNPLKPYECQELNGDQSFAYMRDKRLHSNTEECVGTQKHSDPQKKVAVILDKCSPNDQSQKWDFEQSSDLVINIHTGLCMTSSKAGFYLDRCNHTNVAQHWIIVSL